MAPHNDPALTQMQTLILNWQSRSDPRAAFLECYHMMTGNMLDALEACEFQDGAWVNRLLHRFADYYFTALDAYERQPAQAPAVWQLAHNRAFEPRTPVLQKLLLGVNAHINYDLVLDGVNGLGDDQIDVGIILVSDAAHRRVQA